MACPQDLSGIYTDDEMGQADGSTTIVHARTDSDAPAGLSAVLADSSPAHADVGASAPPPETAQSAEGADSAGPAGVGEDSDDDAVLDMRSKLAKRMFVVLGEAGITDRDERLTEVSAIVGRTIDTSTKLLVGEARSVIATLEVKAGKQPEEPVDAELVDEGEGS
jgi:hypothetical protein